MLRKQIFFLWLVLLSLAFSKFAMAVDEKEVKLGFYTDKSIVASHIILFNDALTKRISEIGNRIVKASGETDMNYTFRVINDPTINAYSAAGGFVYINTGLLDILESEDELAAILGHEIAHIRNHHHIKFIYSAHRKAIVGSIMANIVGSLLGVAIGSSISVSSPNSYQLAQEMCDLGNITGQAIVEVITVSMIKGYGRKQELEADRCAIQYIYKAGYNPYALISVFKKLKSIKDRLEYKERVRTASFVNAKPGLAQRMKYAEDLISKIIGGNRR